MSLSNEVVYVSINLYSYKTSHSQIIIIFFLWLDSPLGAYATSFRGFTITLRHTTLGSTPLDE
jgi:hypothetical protein